MRQYETVIFDLDGTLINTLEDLTDSVNSAMARYGYPSRTITEVRSFVGNGVDRLVALSIPGGEQNADYEKCVEHCRRHYALNMQNKTKPYDGVIELLRELAAKNIKMAVVSNKFDAAVKGLCRTFFGGILHVAIGDSAGADKKPEPDTVEAALKELNASAGGAVYVGDSEVDAVTAKNAGIPFVGVTWGFRDRTVLEHAGADFIIDKLCELLNIIFPCDNSDCKES